MGKSYLKFQARYSLAAKILLLIVILHADRRISFLRVTSFYLLSTA